MKFQDKPIKKRETLKIMRPANIRPVWPVECHNLKNIWLYKYLKKKDL